MKYISVLALSISGLFAHGTNDTHPHFLSSLHSFDFILFVAGLIGTYFIYDKVFKGNR